MPKFWWATSQIKNVHWDRYTAVFISWSLRVEIPRLHICSISERGAGRVCASILGFPCARGLITISGDPDPWVLLSLHHCVKLLSKTVLGCTVLACETVTSVAHADVFQRTDYLCNTNAALACKQCRFVCSVRHTKAAHLETRL